VGGSGDPARCAGLTWIAPSGRNKHKSRTIGIYLALTPHSRDVGADPAFAGQSSQRIKLQSDRSFVFSALLSSDLRIASSL
jgi:hypothetical protein